MSKVLKRVMVPVLADGLIGVWLGLPQWLEVPVLILGSVAILGWSVRTLREIRAMERECEALLRGPLPMMTLKWTDAGGSGHPWRSILEPPSGAAKSRTFGPFTKNQ
jgi:hypothetical protein